MTQSDKATQFSNRIFTRFYVVMVITLIVLGSSLEYILNQMDEADALEDIKQINQPTFDLIAHALQQQDENQWDELMVELQNQVKVPLLLMQLADFAADEWTLEKLSSGDMLALFDVNDNLTLYQRVGDTGAVLAIESQLLEVKDQRAWVLPVFYLLLAVVLYSLIRPFANQLFQLKQAAGDLETGDFSARVEVPASTTLAPIADAFNSMTQKIKHLMLTQRDLVNSVSHELRTPLARLKFSFEELAAMNDTQMLDQTITAMKADVSELELLIDEMLRYAEVNQIKSFAKKSVNIHQMMQELVNIYENPNIKLSTEISTNIADGAVLQCHELSMNRAFSNVIRNGISFASSQCLIRVQQDDENLLVDICDDGVGLSGVNVDRIFEPFFKVANKHRKAGYGLGLSIAHTIAKKHDGSLAVIEGPLPGACFRFVIPLQ